MPINAEIYKHPPTEFKLLNNGVAKVSDGHTEEELRTLRYELQTFVCEGQYEAGLRRILRTYIDHIGDPEQPAAWVSGFFGSGKSHLVKMLRYLWVDYEFPDGATARGLTDGALSIEVKEQLLELTTLGRRLGGLHAASGTLGSGAGDSVRLALLSVVFRSVDLPESYSRARFIMRLKREGLYDHFREVVEAEGKRLYGDEGELFHLRASPLIARAVLEAGGDWGSDEKEVREAIRSEYTDVTDVSNEEMLRAMREALASARPTAKTDDLPCTLIALDEVQQYIGDSVDRSMQVQEAVEACCKGLGGRVLFVGTGQNALQAVPLLHRLMGRFTVKVQLSDADVETVTRKTVLAKKNQAIPHIEKALDDGRPEIDRHLTGTTLEPKPEDRAYEVQDYPVLPARRRFWEKVLQSTDTSGTESQLRNQLKVVDEAVKATADAAVGTVVGGDFVYDRESLLQSGELPSEIDTRVERLRREAEEGNADELDARLCVLAWLIGKLPREGGSDTGIRATPEMMADLIVEDLTSSSAALRGRVQERLRHLEESGHLMLVGGEYRIQTTQSAEWDRAFRNRFSALVNDRPTIAADRDDALRTRVLKKLESVNKVKHGSSNTPRPLEFSYGGAQPASDKKGVPVWIRTGWNVSIDSVKADAREAGLDSPLVIVYLPQRSDDAIKKALATVRAAEETLHTKGVPTEPEGREARKSIETRKENGEADLERALDDVFRGAQVFLAGGSEISGDSLAEAVETAAYDAVQRLFPEFDVADDLRWGKVFERATKGASAALEAIDYKGKPTDHPVCSEVRRYVGAGKKGSDIRKHFEDAPYGWPTDAVNGALAVLTLHGHLRASRDGQSLDAKDLDARGIAHVRFEAEDVVLTFPEKLAIAGLFNNADKEIKAKPNEVHLHVGTFLKTMRELAERAGGEAPLPPSPNPPILQEISSLTGNQQLKRIYEAHNELNEMMSEWGTLENRKSTRLPSWNRALRALRYADGLPETEDIRNEVDSIREQRSLLAEENPLDGLDERIFAKLRSAVSEVHRAYKEAYEQEMATLKADAAWQNLDDASRSSILAKLGLDSVPGIDVSTPEAILASLDQISLDAWRHRTDALEKRFRDALTKAAREAEPEARSISLPTVTLRTGEEVEQWLDETRSRLMKEIDRGPIII